MDFNETLKYLQEMLTPQEQQYIQANPNKKAELIAKKNRSLAAPTFAADGLYLTQVGYPEHF
jgi:tRNA U38,U39,U40 pseudouridine synthase TruA